MRSIRLAVAALAVLAIALTVSACGAEATKTSDYQKVQRIANVRHAYIPHNNVEFKNYNDAQKLYDDPSTIVWCSTTWGNASAPLVTVPVAGKLTSSTVSYFPTSRVDNSSDSTYNPDLRSVDGMFHGTPPPYRYGFTPGGQYVDFFNMPTFCTTALTKFQRQATKVTLSLDPAAQAAQVKAEADLRSGDKAAAQKALEGIGG